jgi:hypothetical protein
MTSLGVVLGLLLVGAAPGLACGEDGSSGDRRVPTVNGGARHGGLAQLAGTWVATDSGGAELVYQFRADGTYKHAAVLLQQREAGLFSLKIGAQGSVTVRGRLLVLRPTSGFKEVEDPDRPSRSFRSAIDRSPERYEWTLDVAGSRQRLRLTDATGITIAYIKR